MASLSISADMRLGNVPFYVKFTPVPDGINVVSWLWEFGDGYRSRQRSPTHIYRDPGKFDVRLTVEDSSGYVHTAFQSQYITVFNISIESTKQDGDAPLKIKFSISEFLPEGFEVDSYSWDFADGSDISTESSPVHIFQSPGSYPVSLVATVSRT